MDYLILWVIVGILILGIIFFLYLRSRSPSTHIYTANVPGGSFKLRLSEDQTHFSYDLLLPPTLSPTLPPTLPPTLGTYTLPLSPDPTLPSWKRSAGVLQTTSNFLSTLKSKKLNLVVNGTSYPVS